MDKFGKDFNKDMAELQKLMGDLTPAEKNQIDSMLKGMFGIAPTDLFESLGMQDKDTTSANKTTETQKPNVFPFPSKNEKIKSPTNPDIAMINGLFQEFGGMINDDTVNAFVENGIPLMETILDGLAAIFAALSESAGYEDICTSVADMTRVQFEAYIDAGFTEDQAFILISGKGKTSTPKLNMQTVTQLLNQLNQ